MSIVSQQDHPLGLVVLGASAMIEYLFPPFPGDTITLFGAVLISAHGWSFSLVFASVVFASVVGSMFDFAIGTRLTRLAHADHDDPKISKRQKIISKMVNKFRDHGAAYLLISRFLPGVRALVFVAAGVAEMRTKTVFFYSIVSAIGWNLIIVGLGVTLGLKFKALVAIGQQYSLFVLLGLGVLLLFFGGRAYLRRKRKVAASASSNQ